MGSRSTSRNALPDEYEQSAARKGDFFARKVNENASRAEGVHPSQGGKYVGFGSTQPPGPSRTAAGGVSELTGMFASWGSRFAAVASTAVHQAQTTVSSTARTLDEQYRSGQLAHTVQVCEHVCIGAWYFCHSELCRMCAAHQIVMPIHVLRALYIACTKRAQMLRHQKSSIVSLNAGRCHVSLEQRAAAWPKRLGHAAICHQ